MKYLNKIIVLLIFTVGIISCDENENFEIQPAAERFSIATPISGSTIALTDANPNNQALFLSWQDTGSEGASYTIEIALTGSDFANATVLATTNETEFSMTVEELNTFLLDVMGFEPEEAVSLDIRVDRAGEKTAPISIVFVPYTVEYTEMYLVGSFTNWNPGESLPMTNTGFNLFEITVDIPDGGEFKFIPQQSGWDNDWGKDPGNDGVLVQEGEMNLSGYGPGKFTVKLDFNTFTYTVEQVLSPNELYLVGSLTDWNPANAYPFHKVGNKFTVVIDLPAGGEFKFLPQNTGWEGDWGADPNNAGSIIQDGESNVSGLAAGKYLVTVDFDALTYKTETLESLFLVGSLTGWDPATSIAMGEASLGIFSTIIDLPDGAEFKFLPQNTGWDGDWGADGANPGAIIQDGESNVSGFGPGLQVISVNFNNLSFNVSGVSEIPSNLYLVGSFRGWSNDQDNPQFTETSSGVFEITETFADGDEFKFVPVAGDWGNDWGENSAAAGVLEQSSEQNVKAPGAGTYKIVCDFNNGTISVTLQ